jgi:hypothetical protein
MRRLLGREKPLWHCVHSCRRSSYFRLRFSPGGPAATRGPALQTILARAGRRVEPHISVMVGMTLALATAARARVQVVEPEAKPLRHRRALELAVRRQLLGRRRGRQERAHERCEVVHVRVGV